VGGGMRSMRAWGCGGEHVRWCRGLCKEVKERSRFNECKILESDSWQLPQSGQRPLLTFPSHLNIGTLEGSLPVVS
jgi:hypothetical protein